MKHVKLFEGYKSNWEDEENFDPYDYDLSKIPDNTKVRRSRDSYLCILGENLEFISNYNVELYEIIDIIEKILNSTWGDLKEWEEHLESNATKSDADELTLALIFRRKPDFSYMKRFNF
jgi:hypothetical protein